MTIILTKSMIELHFPFLIDGMAGAMQETVHPG